MQSKGRWRRCKVVEVVASIARLRYSGGREEWLYRGSARLWPRVF